MKNGMGRTMGLLGRAVSLVLKSSRGLTIANLLLTVLQGVLPLIPLFLMKLLIDSIDAVINGSTTISYHHIGMIIALMGGAALLAALAKAIGSIVEQTQAAVVTDYMQDILHGKSLDVDLAYYEDSRFYDTLHRAQGEAPFRPTSIVNGLISTAQNGVSLLAMVGLLLSFHWFIAVVLVAAALPGVLVKIRFSKVSWNWQRARTETERKAWYRHWLLTSAGHAQEIRLLGLGEYFRKSYRVLRTILRKESLGIAGKKAAADLATQAVATALVYGALAFIAWQAFGGLITIGGMVLYFQAFQKGLGYLKGLLGSLADLYEGNLFLANLFDFLDLRPTITDPSEPKPFPSPIREGIVFDDVSFEYSSSRVRALDGVSLSIRPGEMLALVGENGSGKSTLIKLLCRLYDPDTGVIAVDGMSIRDFSLEEYRSNISVIFQEYARYHLTAGENISLGDVRHSPDESAVRKAAATAGVDTLITRLPEGYGTVLGRWFKGGKELSMGEWQKIALARAFIRDAPVIILDEPTSALDARAEQDLFLKFRDLARGRTAIVISHRFSTVRMADRIGLMHRGRIAELGTHEELMDLNGRYREMFTIQAGAYH
jgi:ATP-binding cassette, subfamily B, bacterial